MVAPKIRSANRPACAPRQCPITLIRTGEILNANLTADICHIEFGPLTVHSRCFEQSIPGPTLSIQAASASSLPATLRVNLQNQLDSSEFSAKIKQEMIDKVLPSSILVRFQAMVILMFLLSRHPVKGHGSRTE